MTAAGTDTDGTTGADDASDAGGTTGADDASDASGTTGADDASDAPVGSRGRGRMGLVVSLVVAAVLVGFVVVLATSEPATERRASSPLIGRFAPALVGETLDTGAEPATGDEGADTGDDVTGTDLPGTDVPAAGEVFDIDDHQDSWVVVNFFATWCGPCIEEHPELVAFSDAHAAAGDAVVVSVVYDDTPENVRDFFVRRGGDWPVINDGGGAAVDYGVVKVPETYLVAPGGQVVQKYSGGVTREMLDGDIEAVEAAAAARSGGGAGS